jgi:hypothetical protein
VNGVQSTEANHRQAYVEQRDNFYSMLSVAETLTTYVWASLLPLNSCIAGDLYDKAVQSTEANNCMAYVKQSANFE